MHHNDPRITVSTGRGVCTILAQNTVLIYSPPRNRYRNAAALQAHAQGPHFKAFVAKAAPLMAKPFELKKADGILPASVGVARL